MKPTEVGMQKHNWCVAYDDAITYLGAVEEIMCVHTLFLRALSQKWCQAERVDLRCLLRAMICICSTSRARMSRAFANNIASSLFLCKVCSNNLRSSCARDSSSMASLPAYVPQTNPNRPGKMVSTYIPLVSFNNKTFTCNVH